MLMPGGLCSVPPCCKDGIKEELLAMCALGTCAIALHLPVLSDAHAHVCQEGVTLSRMLKVNRGCGR